MSTGFVFQAVVSGVFATVVLDLFQRLLFAVAGIPPANWAMVGRWFAHIPRGRLFHDDIAQAEPVQGELRLGWIMHYLVGIAYGFVYLGLIVLILERAPSFLNGLVFGVVSVVIPWFLMQPGLGAGVMARKTPKPIVPVSVALANHTVYGIALFAGAVLAGA